MPRNRMRTVCLEFYDYCAHSLMEPLAIAVLLLGYECVELIKTW